MTSKQQEHLSRATGATPEPYRVLPDGTALWIYVMTFGKGRLCIGHVDDRYGYDRGFCYASLALAFQATPSI